MFLRLMSRLLLPIFTFLIGSYITTLFHLETCPTKSDKIEPNRIQDELIRSQNTALLFISILSAPDNADKRAAIRDTWIQDNEATVAVANVWIKPYLNVPVYYQNGFMRNEFAAEQRNVLDIHANFRNKQNQLFPRINRVKFIARFIIGSGTLNHMEKEMLKQEQEKHKDLIIFDDFHDSYVNLTAKLVKTMRTVMETIQFKYFLKVDDDSFVKLDQLLPELDAYDQMVEKEDYGEDPIPMLYWGYFHGRAKIKTHGKWKESNYKMCDHYSPYALGGGYILSRSAIQYITDNWKMLNFYASEDVSIGSWLSPLRTVHRRHDIRFNTGYVKRKCQSHHIVIHPVTTSDMYDMAIDTESCSYDQNINQVGQALRRPLEYTYNWLGSPTKCCDEYI